MLRVSFLLLALSSTSVLALAQGVKPPVSAPPEDTRPIARKVNIAAGKRTPDEELLALAQAAHFNVLADAGEMAPAASSPARQGVFLAQLNNLAQTRHLTWLQSGPNTLLAWQEPDALALAKEIAQTLNAAPPPVPVAPHSTPAAVPTVPATGTATTSGTTSATPSPLNEELWRFFETRKAKEQAVPIALLPAPLQARVLEAMQGVNANTGSSVDALWFSDEFWKQAHLRIQTIEMTSVGPDGKFVKTPTPLLLYGGNYSVNGRRGFVLRGLGFAPLPK